MPSHRFQADNAESLSSGAAQIGDPGDTKTISYNLKGFAKCMLTVGASNEMRVLDSITASNYFVGEILLVDLQTTGGGVVTISGAATADGTQTLSAAGDFVVYEVVSTAVGTKVWRVIYSSAGVTSQSLRGLGKATVTSDVTASGSPTVAQLRGGVYEVSGGSTYAMTLPTGAVMLAGLPGCTTGDSFDCLINNNNSGTLTMSAGATGSTLEGSAATIATAVCRLVRFVITTGSTGAYTAYAVV